MTGAYSSAPRVLPQVGEPVVGRRRQRDLVARDDDRAALAVVLLGELPGVARVLAQLVGADDLDVVDVDDQQREQHEHADRDAAQRGVHGCTTSVGASPRRCGGAALRCGRPAGGVADPDEQRHQHEVGDQGRAAVGQERRRQPGQREQAGDAAEDDEHLPGDRERQPGGQQLAEGVAHDQRRPQAPLDQDQVDDDHRDEPEQAELLADGGGDEVALGHRHLVGAPAAEAGAEEAAGAEAEQRLHQLVAGAVLVGEGVQPDVDAGADVTEDVVGDERADGEQPDADQQPARPLGGDVEHHDEDAEQQQRAAEVALEDQHEDRQHPGHQHRPEVAAARQLDARPPCGWPAPARRACPPGRRRRRRPGRSWRTPRAGWRSRPAGSRSWRR